MINCTISNTNPTGNIEIHCRERGLFKLYKILTNKKLPVKKDVLKTLVNKEETNV